MKIAQSDLMLESRHTSARSQSERVALRAWAGERRPDFERDSRANDAGVLVSISRLAQHALMRGQLIQPSTSTPMPDASHSVSTQNSVGNVGQGLTNDDPRLAMLIEMLEELTGLSVRVFDAAELLSGAVSVEINVQMSVATTAASPSSAPARWGLEIDTNVMTSEREFMTMQSSGVVQTTDGKQIAFDLQLEMSREFVQNSQSTLRAGDAARIDPLVINFNGTGAQLANTRFSFDLNADGKKEDIAFVAGGSGFLVLDKNGDGSINDGSEMFGPASGDGFQDLARYDSDGNQWIDESDPVFSQLQVWQRNGTGKDKLSTLSEAGVGALYLGRVASPFSVNNPANNQTIGVVRSSGVFLYESGQAGSLQQVDL